jgi:glutathione synthase/RimK-type ligase-like ATP-grasp enzyme
MTFAFSSLQAAWSARSTGSRRPGEWRTNVDLGAVRRAVDDVPREAAATAVAAARAAGAVLVGVDLLPGDAGGWVVVELNGAVEFTAEYSRWCDVFAETALLLEGEVYDRQASAGAEAAGSVLH